MRVLVTGGSGFIGAALCKELVAEGHQVAALLRPGDHWRLKPLQEQIEFIEGELDQQSGWTESLHAFQPEAVAHLAWRGVAGDARNSLLQLANLEWSAELLERCADAGATVFLGLGSQAEYGPKTGLVSPNASTEPTTLYGEVKLATARICAKLAEARKVRFVWMRVFSTYGAGDHPYWMIPNLIGALIRAERPALTEGRQLWDFLNVADAARAIRLALESPAAHGVYALGSGNAPELRSTIETIRDAIDPELPLGFGDTPYRTDQVMRLQADIGRLTEELGWRPQIPLTAGLRDTVDWYRRNPWIFDSGPSA